MSRPPALECAECGCPLDLFDDPARCPTCGAATARWVTGPRLREGDPVGVNLLYRGLQLVNAATILTAIALPAVGFMWALTALMHAIAGDDATTPVFWRNVLIGVVFGWTASAAAGFVIATRGQRRLPDLLPRAGVTKAIDLMLVSIVCAAAFGYVLVSALTLGAMTLPVWALHVLVGVVWLQAISLSRWLTAVEERLDPAALAWKPEWMKSEIVEEVRRVMFWRVRVIWSYSAWRGFGAYVMPPLVVGMYWWYRLRHGDDVPWILPFAAMAPWMIMLMKWRVVRAVGVEARTPLAA